jgi:hypothetical protein
MSQEKDPVIPLASALIGIGLLLTPVDWQFKLISSGVLSIPGFTLAASEVGRIKDRKSEAERLENERRALEEKIALIERSLLVSRSEIEQQLRQLEADLQEAATIKASAENEARQLKQKAEAEIEALWSEVQGIENSAKATAIATTSIAESESDRILQEARLKADQLQHNVQLIEQSLRADVVEVRRRAAQSIKRARRHWRSRVRLLRAEFESALKTDRKELEIERDRINSELALERAQTQETVTNALREAEEAKLKAQEEIKALKEEFEQEKQEAIDLISDEFNRENEEKLEKQRQALNKQLEAKQQKLNDLIDQANQELEEAKANLQEHYEATYQQWLLPHVIEVNRLQEEIEDWKSRYMSAEEELAASKDILLPENPWSHDHKSKAYNVLLWFKSKGVMLNYYNSAIDEDGNFTLFFKPWQGGAKGKKAIEGCFDGMISDWGLIAKPQLGETVESWFLKMMPAANKAKTLEQEFRQFGGFPFNSLRVPVETEQQLQIPISFDGLGEETRRRAMTEASYQQKIDFMMTYKPGKLPKPVTYEITPQELKAVDWWTNWRSVATKGAEPNIREVNRLLTAVYGLSVGSSTESRDRVTGESLRQRMHRIMHLLKIESRVSEDEN